MPFFFFFPELKKKHYLEQYFRMFCSDSVVLVCFFCFFFLRKYFLKQKTLKFKCQKFGLLSLLEQLMRVICKHFNNSWIFPNTNWNNYRLNQKLWKEYGNLGEHTSGLFTSYILQSHIHDDRAYKILKTAMEDLRVENGCEFFSQKKWRCWMLGLN